MVNVSECKWLDDLFNPDHCRCYYYLVYLEWTKSKQFLLENLDLIWITNYEPAPPYHMLKKWHNLGEWVSRMIHSFNDLTHFFNGKARGLKIWYFSLNQTVSNPAFDWLEVFFFIVPIASSLKTKTTIVKNENNHDAKWYPVDKPITNKKSPIFTSDHDKVCTRRR